MIIEFYKTKLSVAITHELRSTANFVEGKLALVMKEAYDRLKNH